MRSLLVILCLTGTLCTILARGQPSSASRRKGQDDEAQILTVVGEEKVSSSPPTSSSSSSIPPHPDPESLPPDTFRKLAQALYQRGDKAANRLQRKFFYNDNVTCNDGSVAGFYIRRNYASKRWVVFLEGGWICHDEASCSGRASREHHRMSSDRWPSVKTIGGILSADPNENPHFADANHVFVPYCSSDSWSGTAKARGGTGTAFLGHYIVKEVIRELADFEQLLFHDELFLAGSSAGGTGVLVNVDFVAEMVAPAGVRTRGIVDSGWFLDNDPFATEECRKGGKCSSVIKDFKKGVEMWRARVPGRCAERFPGEDWKCFFGYKAFPVIQTPLFIVQWQFDKFQMYAANVALPSSRDQWNYIHQLGEHVRETFSETTAVFAPACIAHEVITKQHWTEVKVSGVSLPDALRCWAETLPEIEMRRPPANLEIRSQVAERYLSSAPEREDNAIAASNYGGLHSRSASMLADSPHSYKLASNLIRSISTHGGGSSSSRNSIDSHFDEDDQPADGGRRNGRRRKISNNRTNGGRNNKARRRGGNRGRNRSNGDLVRSLDRRSSHHEVKKTKKNKGGLTKEQRRQRRKERRKLKKERERRKRRRERKREKRRKRREEKEKRKRRRHHLKVRSAEEEGPGSPRASSCQTKLIDTCTWPHCNRSCPKLKNPETGQEIDFLSLLQSFGLDMSSVARALGVDIVTLNNMDRDQLYHMLTSSSPQGQSPKL